MNYEKMYGKVKTLIIYMILTLIIIFNSIIISVLYSHAAEPEELLSHGIRSYGRIEIDQNDDGIPDTIFEAKDIYNLMQKCK